MRARMQYADHRYSTLYDATQRKACIWLVRVVYLTDVVKMHGGGRDNIYDMHVQPSMCGMCVVCRCLQFIVSVQVIIMLGSVHVCEC